MGKQLQIEGTERKQHKDVTKAAEAYVDVRDNRMELTRQEVAARAVLIDKMKKHGLTEYVDGDLEVLFDSKTTEKVKVKRLGDSDDAGEE